MVETVGPAGTRGVVPTERGPVSSPAMPFSVQSGAGPVTPAPIAPAVPAIGLESMLALQAVDDTRERDAKARKRGAALIAALSDLQRAMLAEEDPALALRALSGLVTNAPEAADPGLASVMRAIVLRARVEVALRAREEFAHGARREAPGSPGDGAIPPIVMAGEGRPSAPGGASLNKDVDGADARTVT